MGSDGLKSPTRKPQLSYWSFPVFPAFQAGPRNQALKDQLDQLKPMRSCYLGRRYAFLSNGALGKCGWNGWKGRYKWETLRWKVDFLLGVC